MAIIKIVNVQTGEEIEREMNAKELASLEADRVKAEQDIAEAEAKAQAKAAAEAKLVALGLDLDDLRALGL
jgi:hypothetical protein